MRHAAYLFGGLVPVAALLLSACGGPSEYALVGSARAPSVDGTVTVERIEGGNSLITVQMRHLPPPERLGDGLKLYLMWLETPNAPAQMVSRLGYDPDSREASAMATTPHQEFTVKITAEKNAKVSTPNDVVVAERKVGQ